MLDVTCYGLFGLGRQRAVRGAGMPRMGTSMRGLALRDIARLDTVGAARILERPKCFNCSAVHYTLNKGPTYEYSRVRGVYHNIL